MRMGSVVLRRYILCSRTSGTVQCIHTLCIYCICTFFDNYVAVCKTVSLSFHMYCTVYGVGLYVYSKQCGAVCVELAVCLFSVCGKIFVVSI